MRYKIKIILPLVLVLTHFFLMAQPNFGNKVEAVGIPCFFDVEKSNTAYYLPGKISMVVDREGKPNFNLLRTGYVGTKTYGDQYSSRLNSIVRFSVKMAQHDAETLARAKAQLWPNGGNVKLLPVPILDIKTNLIFTPLNDNPEAIQLQDGNMLAENKEGLNQKGNYWRQREFTLRLDAKSAELLWASLDSGQCLMSLSYAFFSEGANNLEEEILEDGGQEILANIQQQASEEKDSVRMEQLCVLADAFSIQIDTKKWPELLTKVDINQEIPPAYAALEIRCYDFYDKLRPDLVAKRVEVKAKGVGRGDVITRVNFSPKNPDIYVYNIRFPYAVQLNHPLYYRITSIGNETAPEKTDWIEKTDWVGVLDISSSEDEVTREDQTFE